MALSYLSPGNTSDSVALRVIFSYSSIVFSLQSLLEFLEKAGKLKNMSSMESVVSPDKITGKIHCLSIFRHKATDWGF